MKGLLLDENLPGSLRLPTKLPVVHVADITAGMTDSSIWLRARAEQWVIVTKDADFSQRMLLDQPPPWVVHVRLGNLRLRTFSETLATLWPKIESLLPTHKLVTILPDRIEAVE